MRTERAITYELRNGVSWLGLNRPQKRNAINDALLAELEFGVRRAQEEARALVIFGHGPCFSAGLDLTEHRTRSVEDVYHGSRVWHAAFSLLRHGRIPAIAALHGATIGGGLELAAACHIRIADETAFFALPEGTRGIYVGGGASVHVARLLGTSRMADILGVLHALPRIQDMSEADGLFVESLMIAFTHTGPEAAARLSEFTAKRAPKVAPPSLASTVSSLPAQGPGIAAVDRAAVHSYLPGEEMYAEDNR
jgi:enoyl-CoA hydratase/carnithine racemase